MKRLHKVITVAVMAVILALAAFCVAACGGKNDGDSTSKKQYTLSFMVGTMPYETVTAYAGDKYELTKDDPYRVGYVFDGWSQTANGAVEELPAVMPKENRTYYAIFSARFNLSLNAGLGTIADGDKVKSVKAGENLYELLSGITPTIADGDAEFDGWFLRGTQKITATANNEMPANNVEVVAKYLVSYTVNVYKEATYDTSDYGTPTVKTGKAYAGERITGLTLDNGYYYDDEMENTALSTTLNKNSTQNKLNVYCKLRGYETVFNANLPSNVEYDGKMETPTYGFGSTHQMPACNYTADGYRFQGWSSEPNGKVEYREGSDFTVNGAATYYAQWVKGMTEISGLSEDRIYVLDEIDAQTQQVKKVAYLERIGYLNDIRGEYNATTGVFTFAYSGNPDVKLLRGIADFKQNTFTYLNNASATQYKLQKIDGTVDSAVTLTLSDNGNATYNDGTDTLTGKYYADADGSMLFSSGDKKFAFRLVQSYEDKSLTNFMIRGEEFGAWNNISHAGTVDLAYTLDLDGYGYATMSVSGLNNSLSAMVTTDFTGRYIYSANAEKIGDVGIEVIVTLFNSSYQTRVFACLLMRDGEYYTVADKVTVYSNVYLERFEVTLYGAPEQDEQLDKDTADKIVLSGYGVLEDSATYTYTNSNNQQVTVKGKYEYDNVAGTLRITPKQGEALLFEISMSSDDENPVPLFEPVEKLFGQYAIIGLDQVYGPSGFYTLHIFNNNDAAFAFYLPVSDSFYGNVVYEYTRLVFGSYEIANYGEDDEGNPDEQTNEYEFTAQVNPYIANYIYSLYSSLRGYPLDITGFANFRFQFVYNAETKEISYVTVSIRGDFQEGKKFTYNGIEYTMDGFGTAVGTDANDKNVELEYNYDSSLGFDVVSIVPDPKKPDEYVLFIDAKGNGVYVEADEYSYRVLNADTAFNIIFFNDGTALLTLSYNTGMGRIYYSFSYGTVTWDDDKIYGHYVRDDSVEFSDLYVYLNKMYSEFDFAFITVGEGANAAKRIYIYDVNEDELEEDGTFIITNSNGDELTITRNNSTAVYIEKGDGEAGDTTYNGTYIFYDGVLQLTYTTGEGENAKRGAMSFKFKYDSNGKITDFFNVSNEVGYFIDGSDARSYIYLSGEKANGSDNEYKATYYVYNVDDEGNVSYTEYNGTYKENEDEEISTGYDFTYETGELDEENNTITETFTFALGVSSTGIAYFQKWVMQLNAYVYYFTATTGQPMRVGTLTGGGYSNQVFTLGQTQYTGTMDVDEDAMVWVFTATDGTEFYFRIISGVGPILLDGTFIREIAGTFNLSTPVDIEVEATEGEEETEDSPAVEAVPAHTAHITTIEMSGMAYAYLSYQYEGKDMVITGIYVQYSSNAFAFIRLTGDSDNIPIEFRFRLMVTGDNTYIAEVADMDHFGTFEGEDLTLINLNGFDYAYYIDSYGRVFTGAFTVVNEEADIVRIVYIDTYNYSVEYVYVLINQEDGTYVTLAPDDSRIPQDDDDDNA